MIATIMITIFITATAFPSVTITTTTTITTTMIINYNYNYCTNQRRNVTFFSNLLTLLQPLLMPLSTETLYSDNVGIN